MLIDALQIIPLHNNTHSISYYGDWEGNATVIVALSGSCGENGNIVDRCMKQWCKKITLAWLKIFDLGIGASPVT